MLHTFSRKQLDNFHIVLWLIKDIFWVKDVHFMGIFMIIPTVGVAIILTLQSIAIKKDFHPNFSILCWMAADSIWMLDDFFALKVTFITSILFGIGVFSMIYYYVLVSNIFKVKAFERIKIG